MKKIILILLITMTSIFSQEVDQKVEKKDAFNIFGGWSIPDDDGSDDTSAGFNGGVAFVHKVYDNISVGGSMVFNRWNESLYIPFIADIEASLTYMEFLGLIRLTSKITGTGHAFLQLGMGNCTTITDIEVNGESEFDRENHFLLSFSGGLVINKILFNPSYEYVFTDKGGDAKWIRLSLGFSL